MAVDDSPGAERAFAEARLQAMDNPNRSAALLRDLLAEYGERVIALTDRPEELRSVRRSVIDFLLRNPGVLQSWRRMTTAEAKELLDTEAPDVVFRRLPVTPAATEAGLRMAQLAVESRQVGRARRLLEEIEAWPQGEIDRGRIETIEILALIVESQTDAAVAGEIERRVSELERDHPDVAERLEEIFEAVRATKSQVAPWRVAGRAWTELWQEPLQDSLTWRRLGLRVDGPVSERSLQTAEEQARLGTYLTVVPVLVDDLVVINEGYLLQGLDRYTGRLVWYRDFSDSRGPLPRGAVVDLNRIVLTDGDAFTVLGHAFREGRDGSGSLVRFDPRTGDVRWEFAPRRTLADAGFQDVEFSGPPIVIGSRVLVPLRQVNTRQETLDLVLAVDREQGRVAWIRMVASSGRVRNSLGPSFTELSRCEDDVLVASATGAVARMDAMTGEVLWLRRVPVPLRLVWSQSPPWLIGRPVVLGDRIATISPDGRTWSLLSIESGEVLRSFPVGRGTSIGNARRFMVLPGRDGADDRLLGIGDDVVAVTVDTEVSRVWSLGERLEEEGLAFGPEDARGVRGLVVGVPDGLLIPLGDGVLHLDTEDLSIRRILDFPEAANPVADDRSIVLAGSTILVSAMPEREALASLRDRVRGDRESVLQPLALFDLARQVDEPELAIEAMEAAVAILDSGRDEEWRDEVMNQILEAIADDSAIPQDTLLSLADRLVIDPYGRVRVELARGDFLERTGQPKAAVEVWSAVIGDPALEAVVVPAGEFLSIFAGDVARQRIDGLCTEDAGIRAMIEDRARREGADAIARRASASELIAIALRNQDRPAGLDVALRVVEVLRDEKRPRELLAFGMVMARANRSEADRERVLAAITEALGDVQREDLAKTLRLAVQPDARRAPMVHGLDRAFESLSGMTRVEGQNAFGDPSSDRIFVRTKDGDLVSLDAPDLSTRWSTPIGGQDVQILEQETADIVGLTSKAGNWMGLRVHDSETGELIKAVDDLAQFLPPPESVSRNPDGFLPNGQPFFPFEILLVPSAEGGVGMIRRDGDVAYLDLDGPPGVRWSRKNVLDRVNGFLVRPEGVHVFGARVTGAGDSRGAIVTLDPETGRELWSSEVGSDEIRWLERGPLGRLVAASLDAVHVLDPVAGLLGQSRGWQRTDPRLFETSTGWLAGDRLVLVDGNGVPVVFDARFGGIREGATSLPSDPTWIPGPLVETLRLDLGRRVLVFSDRLVLLGASGELLGADALPTAGRENLSVALAEDGLYVLYRQVVGNSYRRRIQRLDPDRGLLIDGPSLDFEPLLTAAEELDAVDGWLLLLGMEELQALRPNRPVADG